MLVVELVFEIVLPECMLKVTSSGVASASSGGASRGTNVIALKPSTVDHYVDLSRTVRACESVVGVPPSVRVGACMLKSPVGVACD